MTKYFLFLLLASTFAFAGNYDNGVEAFKSNDFDKAVNEFEAAISNKEKTAESLYYLKIINEFKNRGTENFNIFQRYLELVENPSPYIHPIAPYLSAYAENEFPDDDILDEIEDLLEDDEITLEPQLINTIRTHLANYYKDHFEYDDMEEQRELIGSIKDWKILGEFENISGSGFNKDHGALANPGSDAKFINKLGAEVEWFHRKFTNKGEWVYLNYNFYADNSIIYAQTYIKSEQARTVHLRIGTSGSLKAWVNDQLVYSEEEERNNDLDTYISEIKLEAGWNRLLIQIGNSEIESSNFIARITDDKGNFLNDLEFSYNDEQYTKKTGEAIKVIKPYHEKYFEDKLAQSDDLLTNLILAEIYLMNQKDKIARQRLIRARELAPESFVLYHKFIELYSASGDRTLLSMEVEELKKKNPDDIIALEILFNEAMEKEDYSEAEKLMDKIAKYQPESLKSDLYSNQIKLYSAMEKEEQLFKLVVKAYKEYPRNIEFLYFNYIIAERVEKNGRKAKRILEDYVDETFNYELMSTLAEDYFAGSNINDGMELMLKILENNPGAPGYNSTIGSIWQNMRRYDKAATYFKKCLSIAPYVGAYYSRLGDVYEEQESKGIAESYYRDAINRNPLAFDTREKLRLTLDKEPIWKMFDEVDVDSVIASSDEVKSDVGENVLVLTENMDVVVYENGGFEQKFTYIAKALTKAGTDKLQTYGIPAYRNQDYIVEKAEVVKANGSSLKAEENGPRIVFTNLEEGDYVVLIYRIRNYQYATLIKEFWDKYYINGTYRTNSLRYSIAVENDRKFNYVLKNSDKEPKIFEKENFAIYEWQFEKLEPVKWESYMPPLDDVGVVLHYSSIENWEEIVKWYSKLSNNKFKSDFEVKQIAKMLFEGKEDLPDMDKIQIIYDYVVREIRYSSISFRQSGLVPQKASKVINTKIGDCKDVSTLFKALCNEVGIRSNLVLVNTRNNGEEAMMLPSIDFNHCIANFEIGNEKYFVELTSDNLPFSSFSFDLKNSFVLEISDNNKEPQLLDPKTRNVNYTYRNTNVDLTSNKVVVNRDNIKTGALAASMRGSYRDLTKEEQMKNMLEAINDQFPSIKLNKFEIENLQNVLDSVSYKVQYESNDPYLELRSMSLIKIPWADALRSTDFVSQERRNYPVALWRYFDSDSKLEEMSVNLAEGMELIEVPENVNISNDIFDYKLEFNREGNELKCTRTFNLKRDKVSIEEYTKFRNDFESAVKADKYQIGVKSK